MWQIEDILQPKSRERKLYPFVYPDVPNHALEFFVWLRTNVSLVAGGMGGVSFRHNMNELRELMSLEDGMSFKVLRPFLEEFEQLLMQQYHNAKES